MLETIDAILKELFGYDFGFRCLFRCLFKVYFDVTDWIHQTFPDFGIGNYTEFFYDHPLLTLAFIIAFLLILMVIYTYQEIMFEAEALQHVMSSRTEIPMVPLRRKFGMEILDPSSATLNGVRVRLRGKCFHAQVYWGVPIYNLRQLFALSIEDIISQLPSFGDQCLSQHPFPLKLRPGTEEVTLTFRCVENLHFQGMARDRYPFVIIMVASRADVFEGDLDSLERLVVAECIIMHVDYNAHNGRILDRWIKPYDGPVGSTKTIYYQGMSDGNEHVICLLCSEARVCVLLPCGHACVCSVCSRLIVTCPVCMRYFEGYFEV